MMANRTARAMAVNFSSIYAAVLGCGILLTRKPDAKTYVPTCHPSIHPSIHPSPPNQLFSHPLIPSFPHPFPHLICPYFFLLPG